MSKVATVFGVMGKSLGLLPDAVAARGSFNVIKNQNRFKIGAAGSQFQTASRRRANARSTSRTSGCCQTYGISMGWLLCGDLKALQRMMQAPLGKEAATPEREVCPPVGLGAPDAQQAKTCCTRGAATANVHASSPIRCCGNVDKRCKFAAQNKGAGFRPRSCAVSAV